MAKLPSQIEAARIGSVGVRQDEMMRAETKVSAGKIALMKPGCTLSKTLTA